MTYIDSIIAITATAIITFVVEHFSAQLIILFTKYTPKNKRVALLASFMIKYIFFALLMVFFVLKMDFDKLFVVSIALLVLVCSYFITKDAMIYTFQSVTFSFEKEDIQSKIDQYINALGKCNPKDNDTQSKYKQKIKELENQKDSYM